MGIKRATFVGGNGNTYEVTFEGDNLSSGDLTLGVPPVTISMAAGKHKFCGFKSTTATVNIVSDVLDLGFYTDRVDGISLTINDLTDNVCEFFGYVTPFSFDARYREDYSTFAVDAVDTLSVRKYMKYADNVIGNVGVTTAYDVVTSICHRIGIDCVVVQASFDRPEGSLSDTGPLIISISECGFVQDEMSDCDVVSAIAQFFGYTAIVLGRTLIMYDESCLTTRYAYVSTYENNIINGWQWYTSLESTRYFQRLNLSDYNALADTQVTIDRAYDGIVISPRGTKEAVILPDICDDDNLMERLADTVFLNTWPHVEERTLLESRLITCGYSGKLGVEYPPIGAGGWENGAVFMRVSYQDAANKLLSDGSNEWIRSSTKSKNVLWIRGNKSASDAWVAKQKEAKVFSHPGGYVKVSLLYTITPDEQWDNITSSASIDDVYKVRILKISCGDKVFNSDFSFDAKEEVWSYSGLSYFLAEGNSLLPTGEAMRNYSNDVILKIPSEGGGIRANIEWAYVPISQRGYNYFIEGLSITGWGDEINKDHPDLYHSFSGRTDEMLEVNIDLTSRDSGYVAGNGKVGVNARPGVVCGMDGKWKGKWHLTDSDHMPITGCLMEQLKSIYGKKRIVETKTILGRIPPYARTDKGFVDAYEWDVLDDRTTITTTTVI